MTSFLLRTHFCGRTPVQGVQQWQRTFVYDNRALPCGLCVGGGRFKATYRDGAFGGAAAKMVPCMDAAAQVCSPPQNSFVCSADKGPYGKGFTLFQHGHVVLDTLYIFKDCFRDMSTRSSV